MNKILNIISHPLTYIWVTTVEAIARLLGTRPSWYTDYDTALAHAQQDNKKVLAYFGERVGCGACAALRQEVFENIRFWAWADNNIILLELDSTNPEFWEFSVKYNLLDTNNRMPVPTVICLEPDGAMRGEMTRGYSVDEGEGVVAWIARFENNSQLDICEGDSCPIAPPGVPHMI